jgi:hypothetical protein
MLPPTASPARTALPTAHFDRNNIPAISGTGHYGKPWALQGLRHAIGDHGNRAPSEAMSDEDYPL